MSQSIPTLATGPATHTLFLIAKKGELPAALSKGLPAHLADHGALKGDRGARLALHTGSQSKVLFGIGNPREFTAQEAAEYGEACGQYLNTEKLTEVSVQFPAEITEAAVALNFLKGMLLANYRVDEFKSTRPDPKKVELKKVSFDGKVAQKISDKDLKDIAAIARGIAFARTLVELPPAVANPQGICDRFKAALDSRVLSVEIWDEKRMSKEGMGLLLAVGRGSECPPRFLITRYGKDFGAQAPLVLVGKGVTFDTGGINLKAIPYKDLLSMKGDMAGAAAVLGAMIAIAEVRPSMPVIAVTPLTVNAIGSKATLPGDIITSYAGKTVEIQNTDAEGRLILADAVTYAVKQKAHAIVDVATLTGACAIALGNHHTGLFSNQKELAENLLTASESAGEPAWQLPLSNRYGEELKSSLADLSNMGKGRDGGASLGAKFIEAFVEQTPWAHLDIAGSSDLGGPVGGAGKPAGRMVHTLVSLAIQMGSERPQTSKKRK